MLTTRRSTLGTAATLLVAVLMLASGLAAMSLLHASGPGSAASPAASASPSAPAAFHAASAAPQPAAPTTHGDLVVTSGETYYINSTHGAPVYFQAGNITVESGGTLNINKVNLSFVQFIGSAGTPKVRLSHIVHFLVDLGGTVHVRNSTVTTDMFEINAYPKLNLTVEGTMVLESSTFAFPGWVNVQGAGASLTLNQSTVTRNPDILDFKESTLLHGAEDFAPTLRASAGGVVNMFNSTFSATFADNLSANSTPRPQPLQVGDSRFANGTPRANVSLVPGVNENLTILDTSNTSAALAQDWLYPSGVTGGEVVIYYNNSGLYTTTANVAAWYDGHSYALGTATLQNGTVGEKVVLDFPAALTHAVNTLGMMDYLNFTGNFGTAAAISIDLSGITNSHDAIIVASGIYFLLNPPVAYDLLATGAGTHVNSVDTSLDLTFSPVGADSLSMHQPYPWLANKLSLTDGANASLGNLVAPHAIPGVFESSAVLTDATSHAFLFRWAQVNLSGLGGALPVDGGHVTAYYAYNSVQQNNVTANRANALKTWDLPIWGYLQYWDKQHALPSYATSGFGGKASMLLVSNEITGSSLPDGIFMGGYHFIVVIPVTSGNTHAFNGSVSPYPVGVALGTPGYGMADFAHPQNFPSYFAGISVSKLNVTLAGVIVKDSTVRIGDIVGALVTITDTGTAPIASLEPALHWNSTSAAPLSTLNRTVSLTAVGQTSTFELNWTVNESVTGDRGKAFVNPFDLEILWNHGELAMGGGTLPVTVNVTIEPSRIVIGKLFNAGLVVPAAGQKTPIYLADQYFANGKVLFNGTGSASITLFATPTTPGAAPVVVGATSHAPGKFTITWLSPLSDRLSAGTTYTLTARASYNGVSYVFNVTGEYEVPAPPAPAHNFLTQKFLGLPVWAWIAIAAAVAAGILAFFFVARRQAAGKVVECGECGNLVPETATSCPKCGAEFESDLVRCSRCASTIPASSQFCPECAAQLLGKPGEGGRDPERDGFADFTERFRAEAKKELGENYTEGSFWDWWKRQPTYTSFSQWQLQQQQGAPRGGMMAPPAQTAERPAMAPPPRSPPKGGAPPPASAAPGDRSGGARRTPPPDSTPPPPAAAPAAGGLKPCPNCRKEIPPEYLVCPFCGSVTQ
ncbi:MAG: double zinc ribbon domain-containing protein [Thermoplasmata archaeon]